MNKTSPAVAPLFNWIAMTVALIAALSLPAVYFGLSYQHETASLKTEAEINARIVTQIINGNPQLWTYEELRLVTLLSRRPSSGAPEIRRVFDTQGMLVAQVADAVSPPLMMRSDVLMDAGAVAGKIEILRSMRPILSRTGLVAVFGCALGIVIFGALRVFPLRALNKAVESLRREKERTHTTLQSIGDGVISIDKDHTIEIMNPVAEDFTGWKQQEAIGKSLPEVLYALDEKTRMPIERLLPLIQRAAQAGKSPIRVLLRGKFGSLRTVEVNAAFIKSDEEIQGLVLVFRDVSAI